MPTKLSIPFKFLAFSIATVNASICNELVIKEYDV